MINWYNKITIAATDYDSSKNPLSTIFGEYPLQGDGNVENSEEQIEQMFNKKKNKRRNKRRH